MRSSNKRSLFFLAASLLLIGAGCDGGLTAKLRERLPFDLPFGSPKIVEVSAGVGTRLVVRPSALGSGAIADLLGDNKGAREVAVMAFDETSIDVTWRDMSNSATATSGTVNSTGWASARATMSPALWSAGETSVTGNSLIWLSPKSYAELAASGSSTEWRPALSGGGSSGKALETLEAITNKLSPMLGQEAESTFRLTRTDDIAAYPLRVDGHIESVQAFRASSLFADLVILKNEKTPLILSVVPRPAAFVVLKTLGLAEVIGYEVTEIRNP